MVSNEAIILNWSKVYPLSAAILSAIRIRSTIVLVELMYLAECVWSQDIKRLEPFMGLVLKGTFNFFTDLGLEVVETF